MPVSALKSQPLNDLYRTLGSPLANARSSNESEIGAFDRARLDTLMTIARIKDDIPPDPSSPSSSMICYAFLPSVNGK